MKYHEMFQSQVDKYKPAWFKHSWKFLPLHFVEMLVIKRHYRIILPVIRDAARKHGYGVGVHGTMKRDLDLIAVPWASDHSTIDELLIAIQMAVIGYVTGHEKQVKQMPCGRVGCILPIGYFERIDISIMPGKDQPNG